MGRWFCYCGLEVRLYRSLKLIRVFTFWSHHQERRTHWYRHSPEPPLIVVQIEFFGATDRPGVWVGMNLFAQARDSDVMSEWPSGPP